MTTSFAAALSALELGHLEPRTEDLTGMAPPPSEALDHTTTAIWSDLFATLFNTSLERDIEELGWAWSTSSTVPRRRSTRRSTA